MGRRLKYYLLFLSALLMMIPAQAVLPAGSVIKLWENNGHGKDKVFLKAFVPPDGESLKTAVVICPGGSYFWLAEVDEGEKVGEWLCNHGIAAFVLSYRVGGKFHFATDLRPLFDGNRYPSMLEDAQHSIWFVRSIAAQYGIDEHSIGIMGFSAGGHLAMLSEEIDGPVQHDGAYSKPDFVAMIYPVVSMSDSRIVHKRSRRGLLGEKAGNVAMCDSLSLEKHVPDNCCPVFILHCEDDPVVSFNNSAVMDSALTARSIQHKFIKVPSGGHGFGINFLEKDGSDYLWIDDFASWLQEVNPTGE